ncbi:hypothetical protein BH11PSE7_BH11PSE7_03660 [soil metagenome]
MMNSAATHYQLRYRPIKGQGAGYVFPCDSEGHVDLDELSERARNDYLFARAVVGRELELPAVQPEVAH